MKNILFAVLLFMTMSVSSQQYDLTVDSLWGTIDTIHVDVYQYHGAWVPSEPLVFFVTFITPENGNPCKMIDLGREIDYQLTDSLTADSLGFQSGSTMMWTVPDMYLGMPSVDVRFYCQSAVYNGPNWYSNGPVYAKNVHLEITLHTSPAVGIVELVSDNKLVNEQRIDFLGQPIKGLCRPCIDQMTYSDGSRVARVMYVQ